MQTKQYEERSHMRQTNTQGRLTHSSLWYRKYREEMAIEQNMIWAITQEAIEADKVAIISVKETENPVNTVRLVKVMPRTCDPALKQPLFDWTVTDK